MPDDAYDPIREAIDAAIDRFVAAGENLEGLPWPVSRVVLVASAQGVIDNGGLRYFFEADWPGQPPYARFAEAYREIGSGDVADCIDRAGALFPFDEPQRHEAKRRRFMDSLPESHEFWELVSFPCGNAAVWECLADYIRRYGAEFKVQ